MIVDGSFIMNCPAAELTGYQQLTAKKGNAASCGEFTPRD
jgi:hypothetical protein